MGHFTVIFALIWWPEIESEIWLILNLDGGFLFVELLVAFCSHRNFCSCCHTVFCSLDPTWTSCTLHPAIPLRDSGFLFTRPGPLFRGFYVFLCIDLSLISWSAISGNFLERAESSPYVFTIGTALSRFRTVSA